MSYTIKAFNEAQGQLIVEFDPTMAPLAIDVPIVDGKFIVGEELDDFIKGFIPTWYIERKNQLAAGVENADELRALAPNVIAATPTEEQKAEQVAAQQAEAERQYNEQKAFVKTVVLEVLAEQQGV